jgi:hypothetical protein
MALALMGTLDLSIITDQLIAKLNECVRQAPLWKQVDLDGHAITRFTIAVSGAMPESVRSDGDTQLSLYLFHVTQDRYQLNSPVNPPGNGRALPIPAQPLALDLFYLLTAYSDKNYVNEQRAMSIAMRCFHDAPIIRGTIPIGTGSAQEEYCLTLESQTWEELGRLWQAISAPFRLSAVYRVSVIFITPDAPVSAPAPNPKRVRIDAAPVSLLIPGIGQLSGTISTVEFWAPDSTLAVPRQQTVDYSPAVVAAGQRLQLDGANLDDPAASHTYLVDAAGVVTDVSAQWVDPDATRSTPNRRLFVLPAAQGPAPLATPPPGVYQLRVGGAAGPLSNAVPFSIAAAVQAAGNPPLLTPVAGVYTLPGTGFQPAATQLLLGTVALSPGASPPPNGQFSVVAAGVKFKPPSGLTGVFPVRVRAGQPGLPETWVEAPPTWAVSL